MNADFPDPLSRFFPPFLSDEDEWNGSLSSDPQAAFRPDFSVWQAVCHVLQVAFPRMASRRVPYATVDYCLNTELFREGILMFEVKLTKDTISCLRRYQPDPGGKILKMNDLECEITLKLGISPDSSAAKTLVAEFKKTFDSDIRNYTKGFDKNVKDSYAKIIKFLDKFPEHQKKKPSIVVDEEKYLGAMWEKYCRKLAPDVAHKSLAASIKKLKNADLNKGKTSAAGKALSMPTLTIVGGVVAAVATGGSLGLLAAGLKIASGAIKASQELSTSIHKFSVDQEALNQDLGSLRTAVKSLSDRIKRLEQSRDNLMRDIAGLNADMGREEKIIAQLEKQKDPKTAPQVKLLTQKVADSRKAIKMLELKIVDTERLKPPLRDIVTAMTQIDSQAKKGLKDATDATKATKDLIDVIKETASITDKLIKLV